MRFSLLVLASASLSLAQFIDGSARNLTVVRSPANPNITVSYKAPDGACTTAFDSQRQYTGWVNIPGDYPTNLFFWFVEARERTDGLTIWLNGGPGSSSLYGFFTGNGPCEIVEKGVGKFETVARDWGWDRASNMLFIDQPNQVGFSYDTPTNGTIDFIEESIEPPPTAGADGDARFVLNGTFSSTNGSHTANTTETAAMGVWHMVQGFLTTFPQYHPTANNGSIGINLFAESYGGRYGPIFAETFEEQNEKRLAGQLPRNSTVEIRLNSLGIVNGCIDRQTEIPLYPAFANSNSYGFKAIDDADADFYVQKFYAQDGCRDILSECLTAANASDPEGEGDSASVNSVCSRAYTLCNDIQAAYYSAGRSPYDLAAPMADPFPPMTLLEYLNQADIQTAIGVPVNYTLSSMAVFREFIETGDLSRDGNIPRLAELLNKGVRVGLIYGDRDYICNWHGGEAVSKSLAWEAGTDYGRSFADAGYAPIIVNDSYIGGVVRQYGNLSFSRIYQAGHAVPAYQPETAFQVFARIIMGTSISTGEDIDLSVYNTSGSANATEKGKLPSKLEPTCYIRAFKSTCDDDAQKLAADDGGVVINGVLYSSSDQWPLITDGPTTSASASQASATETLTGVYTATTTPSNGSPLRMPRSQTLFACIVLSLSLYH